MFICKPRLMAGLMCLWIALYPALGTAEDIDIFVGGGGSTANPNVLIVLDNTSNWARQSQKWPGGAQQGQSEVAAIKEVINGLKSDTINVGLMEFVTGSGATNNGGFVRLPIKPLTDDYKSTFSATMDTIFSGINSPDEKRNSNTPYGNLIADAFNYFAGKNQIQGGAATLGTLVVDPSSGYTTQFSKFKSPLSCGTSCAKNYVIFITNPNSSGPASDDATNTAALVAAGGSSSQLPLPNFTTQSVPTYTDLGFSTSCYASQAACNTAGSAAYSGSTFVNTCSDTSIYPRGCTCGTTTSTTNLTCPAGSSYYRITGANTVTTTGTSSKKTYTQNITSPTTVTPSGWPSGGENWSCAGTTTWVSSIAQGGGKYQYNMSCTVSTAATFLGNTTTCYSSQSACQTAAPTLFPGYTTYSCTPRTPPSCGANTAQYIIQGVGEIITNVATSTSTTDTNPFNADEWARTMYSKGVPIDGCSNQTIATYTVDVYNAQPNAQHTSLMLSMARAGGGRYFSASSQSAIVTSLSQIFSEIQSVNSTFASASLPISATNRAQNNNQVFIGMFRPDPDTKPRWFGNVKQYKLIQTGSDITLGDINGNPAINAQTGFISDCADSRWTVDSGAYWQPYSGNAGVSQVKPDASTSCSTSTYNAYSDSPDGPRVEKGSVAQSLRMGNNAPTTATSPTWAVNRNVWTAAPTGTTVKAFNPANTDLTTAGLSSTTIRWVRGEDTEDENGNGVGDDTKARASIHGDVVHSRPLPVNYCGTDKSCAESLITYYGANDGTLRAVNSATGNESWAFIAPEFWSRLDRLRTGNPLVKFPSTTDPTAKSKDYFFDGPIGIYQNSNGALPPDKTWIYPSMRRGGRMLYSLDVSTAGATPIIKWKFGCPNLDNDTGCTIANGETSASAALAMGQTWSVPNIAKIRTSLSTSALVAVVGGGYDSCEDEDNIQDGVAPRCTSPKGNRVYVLDADGASGKTTVLAQFTTSRSVMSDVALIDMNGDGFVDYGYVGDTGGNLYRISFAAYNSSTSAYTPLPASLWTMKRIAYTNGAGRKFQFTPALFGSQGKVFIALGSGDRERPLISNYPYKSNIVNRFYVYRDCLPDVTIGVGGTSLVGSDGITLPSDTKDPVTDMDDTSKMSGTTATGTTSCTATKTTATNCDTNKGWFVDLNNGRGEQTVTSAIITGGLITFSTNRAVPPAAGTCSRDLGEARGYFLNLLNGSGAIGDASVTCGGPKSDTFVVGGLPPSPVTGVVNLNNDGKTFERVILGAVQKKGGGTSSYIDAQKGSVTSPKSRKRVYEYVKSGN